jgi:hypothetical protein
MLEMAKSSPPQSYFGGASKTPMKATAMEPRRYTPVTKS